MTDSQPLVCVFFQLPPSDQLFMRIHDIPWLVLLPQIEKLTYALEIHLAANFSSPSMKTLIQARMTMGSKMLLIRDAILSGRDLSRHYVGFVDGVSQNRMLTAFVKEAYTVIAREAVTKIEEAQQGLFEFREELESVPSRITSVVGGDNNHLSSFITESTQIISVMIPVIEECSALLQECSEGFQNIYKQNFNPESFERNPPSDTEFQLAREKWEMLQNFLHNLAADWDFLESRMANPIYNRVASDTVTPDVQDANALTGIPEVPVSSEGPPNFSHSEKAQTPLWQKLFQCIRRCLSSKLLNNRAPSPTGRHSAKSSTLM